MNVCIPVTPDGSIDPRWGRAARVTVLEIADGAIVTAESYDVGWDVLHDDGTEGGHHARIARFLRDHAVDIVVAGHMGPPMVHMLGEMGIRTVLDAEGDAQAAALTAAR